MRFLNRFDSAKPVSGVALTAVVLLIIAIGVPIDVVSRCLFVAGAVVFTVAAILVIRGVYRRIHLLGVRLQSIGEGVSKIANKAETLDRDIDTIEQRTRSISDIAGSISKGRSLQVKMSGVLSQVVKEASSSHASTQSLPAPCSEDKAEALVASTKVKKNREDENANQLQWQIDHELVLPHNIHRDVERFLSRRLPLATRVRAAVIMDPFSFGSFAPELDLVALQPDSWREQFESHAPQIFICESAWQGIPAEKHPWKARIYSSVRFNYENRKTLLEILDYCKSNGIPTVFWNKEDPTHFTDRVNDFVNTARLFDYIFTTAEEVISGYNKLTGRDSAFCLPFAVQPRIFHPALTSVKRNDKGVVFAGSWYKLHEDRKILQKHLLDETLRLGLELNIYDRYAGQENEQFGFPDEYKKFIHPAVPYERTAALYQSFRYGISINTVIDSKTMLARRAFEMAATGCGIITNTTPATEHFFGNRVLNLGVGEKLSLSRLQELDDARLPLMNDVFAQHTYEARTKQLLDTVGISNITMTERLSVVTWVTTLDQIEQAKERFASLGSLGGNLILIVSQEVDSHRVQEFYKKGIDSVTLVVSEEYWHKNGIRPSTVFDLPLLYVTAEPKSIGDVEQIRRAASHAVYSREPVHPAAVPVWPHMSFGRVDESVVMRADDFDYFMKNDFSERMITVV